MLVKRGTMSDSTCYQADPVFLMNVCYYKGVNFRELLRISFNVGSSFCRETRDWQQVVRRDSIHYDTSSLSTYKTHFNVTPSRKT